MRLIAGWLEFLEKGRRLIDFLARTITHARLRCYVQLCVLPEIFNLKILKGNILLFAHTSNGQEIQII